jgi:cytochrome c5
MRSESEASKGACSTEGFFVGRLVQRSRNAPSTLKENNMKRMFFVIGAVAALVASSQVAAADGKAVYDKSCAGCHNAMKPKTGDKEAWAPLIKQGAGALTASVVKGKGMMPPKGGAASEADVKAAVEYMISQSK